MRRRGDPLHEPTPLPAIVGYEMAGMVAGLGTGVTLPTLGARVFVNARSGAYAQYALAPAESAIEIPAGMDPDQVRGAVAPGPDRRAGTQARWPHRHGRDGLVEAAGGGVGTMAVQIAKLYGAGKVIAAASSEDKTRSREKARRRRRNQLWQFRLGAKGLGCDRR